MVFCITCGSEVLAEAVFCSKCGSKVNGIVAKKREISGKYLLLPIFFGIIGGLIAYIWVREADGKRDIWFLILGIVMTFVWGMVIGLIGLALVMPRS